jgi:hypothetical protein
VALLLYVLHHHFVGHIAQTGRKVAPGPKVPSSKLTVQRLKLRHYLMRHPSLDRLEQIADRNARLYRCEKVNMIPEDVPFENLNVFGLTDLTHLLPQPLSKPTCGIL